MDTRLYQYLAPPLPGQSFLVANSATAARYAIPPQWKGKIVTFSVTTDNLYVLFGSANVMIESAEVSTVVSEVLASNWASGQLIPAGSTLPIYVPDDDTVTHFAVDASGATGQWCACLSSATSTPGEALPAELGKPLMWLDAGKRSSLTVDAGAVTVPSWKDREFNRPFAETTNKPDLLSAAGVGAGLLRPAVSFVAGSSEKLVCTDATLAAALGGTNPFTLWMNVRRTVTGAAHTIFSVGTTGTNNGRWDFSFDASDDIVITRVTSGGSSTTSTVTATITGAYSMLLTFDGTTPLLWVDDTSTALTGSATGDVGTTTKAAVGCRAYNTSTADQFASAEICDMLVFPEAFTGEKLAQMRAYARRRSGK